MKHNPYKKALIALTASIIILIAFSSMNVAPKAKRIVEREIIEYKNTKTVEEANEKKEEPIERNAINKIPETSYLNVPFICQAPLQTEENWKLHEESCEEAAALQAMLFEKGENLTKEEANEVILDMIDWQKKHMGGHFDLYADKMKEFLIAYYSLNPEEVKIIKDATIKDIKREVSGGHPVIVPITAKILNNPYYPYPGYHMLTVIGYTKDKIITNDNGTKRGKDFSYKTEIFEKAMKDAGGEIIIIKLNKSL